MHPGGSRFRAAKQSKITRDPSLSAPKVQCARADRTFETYPYVRRAPYPLFPPRMHDSPERIALSGQKDTAARPRRADLRPECTSYLSTSPFRAGRTALARSRHSNADYHRQHRNRVVGSAATSQSRRRQHHDCNRIARSTAARSRCRQHHSRTAGDTSPHRRQHRSRAVEGHRGSTSNCAAITPSTKPLLLSHDTDRGRKHRRPHSRGSPPA